MLRSGSRILRLVMLLLFSALTACGGQPASETLPTQAVLSTQPQSTTVPTAAPADGSVSGAVDALFTQTAVAQEQIGLTKTVDAMFVNAATATAAFNATVAAEFQQAVLATAQASGVAPVVPVFLRVFAPTGYSLERVNSDGTDHQLLYQSTGIVDEIHVSPDGKWIAFVEVDSGKSLYALNLIGSDGSGFRQIDRNQSAHSVAPMMSWSPTSDRLMYFTFDGSSGQDKGLDVRLYDVQSGSSTLFYSNPTPVSQVAQFTSDGEHVLYNRGDGLYLRALDAQQPLLIAERENTSDYIEFYDLLAQSGQVLYHADETDYLKSVDSTAPAVALERPNNSKSGPGLPVVSPDGQYIAVPMTCARVSACTEGDAQFSVRLFTADGTLVHDFLVAEGSNITPNLGGGAAWSPDSKRLLVQNGVKLYLIDIPDQTVTLLGDDQEFRDAYPWLPDALHYLYTTHNRDAAGPELCVASIREPAAAVCAPVSSPDMYTASGYNFLYSSFFEEAYMIGG